jgi:hypothetical protein
MQAFVGRARPVVWLAAGISGIAWCALAMATITAWGVSRDC